MGVFGEYVTFEVWDGQPKLPDASLRQSSFDVYICFKVSFRQRVIMNTHRIFKLFFTGGGRASFKTSILQDLYFYVFLVILPYFFKHRHSTK